MYSVVLTHASPEKRKCLCVFGALAGAVHGEELQAGGTGHHLVPTEERLPRGERFGLN